MVICCDTSFLFALYGNDVHSARALTWAQGSSGAITVSSFNDYEFGNALRFAEFRKAMSPGLAAQCWAQFEQDLAEGRLAAQVGNLAQTLAEAKRLSQRYTLVSGHRSFDILHVAAALHFGAQQFLTFDANQKKLAEVAGLAVPV